MQKVSVVHAHAELTTLTCLSFGVRWLILNHGTIDVCVSLIPAAQKFLKLMKMVIMTVLREGGVMCVCFVFFPPTGDAIDGQPVKLTRWRDA